MDTDLNGIGTKVIAAAMKVHSRLGPGLLENVYRTCLAHELAKVALPVRQEVRIPVRYDDLTMEGAYRLDLLVDGRVVIELKAIESVLPVHRAQLLSYLKLGGFRLGYLLNFHVVHMREGIARIINGY